MDVHTLVAPFEFEAAQCPSILPELGGYHAGGMIWRKPLSLPIQHTYLEVVGSNPVTGKNFFWHKIKLLAWLDDILAQADFSISLPSHTTCWLLPRTFLLLFLLPHQSLCKLFTLTWINADSPIFLFYPSTHKPPSGCFPSFSVLCGYQKLQPTLFAITFCQLCPHCTWISLCAG